MRPSLIANSIFIFLVVLSHLCVGQITKSNGFMTMNTIYDQTDRNVDFKLGQVVTFITADITDKISILNETTFGPGPGESEFVVSVERAIIKYELNNYLNFYIGKFHTPVSNWNIVYHHGLVLQPGAMLPLLFSRRIIDRHTTGVMVGGDFIGKYNFGYRFLVGNGIGSTAFADNDKNKSLSMNVHAYPIENFQVTLSAYFDQISEGVNAPNMSPLAASVRQSLYSLSIDFNPPERHLELFSEFYVVKNESESDDAGWSTSGFVHTGYSFGKWTPYYRYDFISIQDQDPYFLPGNATMHTVGLRVSFNYLANIKLEYQRTNNESDQITDVMMLQFGIGF